MDNETKKKFSLYRSFGSQLINQGKLFLNKATRVNKKIFYPVSMYLAVEGATGKTPVLYDEKYHTTDIETWKTIIENDWTNKRKYVSDTFDCDNFAGSFCAYCADIYELNTAGRFTVELLNAKTNKHIGYHRAVIIVDDKGDCYLLESQTDKMVKLEKGRDPVIDNWKYKVNYISFN